MFEKIPKKVTRRTGNWCEELVFRQEKLAEFLDKNESGGLSIKKAERRILAIKEAVELASSISFNSNLMLQNFQTLGFLAIDVPYSFPDIVSDDQMNLTTSSSETPVRPCVRSSFQIERMAGLSPTTIPKYGEKIYISAYIPIWQKKLYISSDNISPTNKSRVSKHQAAFLTFKNDYKSLWQFQHPDAEIRMEVEGQPIEFERPFMLFNVATGQHLSSDDGYIIRLIVILLGILDQEQKGNRISGDFTARQFSAQKQMEKETKALKLRIELLEKENNLLKKSLFELSSRYNLISSKLVPFALDSLEIESEVDPLLDISNTSTENPMGSPFEASKTAKNFIIKNDLRGHTGAVYTVEWSACGRFLASGGFDKTIRIWDPYSTGQKELNLLAHHSLNISDLNWSADSTELLSGSYDQSCKIWDVEQGKLLDSFELEGFVQCVSFSPENKAIFLAGTSRKAIFVVDRRDQSTHSVIRNNSMINSIYAFKDGRYILSGDAEGSLKTWDIRTGLCIQDFANENTKKPISHVTACNSSDEDSQLIAVNSYDNIMRVYDRTVQGPEIKYSLTYALKGYINKNWPIKSSFFMKNDEYFSHGTANLDGQENELNEKLILLATGSSDPHVYIYDVSAGKGDLIQRLDGHSDRVYAVNFHPKEAILASCSADFSVKVWHAKKLL